MKSIIVVSALVFLLVIPALSMQMPCETLDRSSIQATQFVRDYLDESKGLFVRVCGGYVKSKYYYGGSEIVREGDICRYLVYELNLSRANPPRLERMTTPPQTYMSVSPSMCPPPGFLDYTATNHVPQDIFERLFQVWHDAISSPESFDRVFSLVPDAVVVRHLRNVIFQGKSNGLVMAMVRIDRDLGALKNYQLNIEDSDRGDGFYAVIVSSQLGRNYVISDVRRGIY